MNFKDLTKKVKIDLIFFIIGFLVFPAVILVSIYSIFSVKEDSKPTSFPLEDLSISITEVTKDNSPSSTDTPPMTSSISTVKTGHSGPGINKSLINQSNISNSGIWSATQYEPGDITKSTYVVQLGDTLWQIANAYYGSGVDWQKILEDNKDIIGFLPNGEQALIYPGQTLNLP